MNLSNTGLFRRVSLWALLMGGMALVLTGCVHLHHPGRHHRDHGHGHAYGHDRAPGQHKDKHKNPGRGKGHDKHGNDRHDGHKKN